MAKQDLRVMNALSLLLSKTSSTKITQYTGPYSKKRSASIEASVFTYQYQNNII